MGVIISKKVRKQITDIFEYENEVYAVHLKDSDETVWVEGKVELYEFLNSLK